MQESGSTPVSPPPASSKASKGGGVSTPVAVILLVVVVAVVVGAFFMEEIKGYFLIQGWDREKPQRIVREFVLASHSDDNSSIAKLVAPDKIEVQKDPKGQVTGLKWVAVNGLTTKKPKDIAPKGEPKTLDSTLKKRGEQTYFLVITEFANGKWGVFRVGPSKIGLAIQAFPEVLDKSRPTNLTFY